MAGASLYNLPIADKRLESIAEKVIGDERLSFDEGMILYRTHDFPTVARLADQVRRRKVGDKAYFLSLIHI